MNKDKINNIILNYIKGNKGYIDWLLNGSYLTQKLLRIIKKGNKWKNQKH